MSSFAVERPALKDLQRWLRWVWTDSRGPRLALSEKEQGHPISQIRGAEPAPRLLPFIESDSVLPADERLSIYSNAYFERLLQTLGLNFSAVKRALGENGFRQVIASYLLEHPSSFRCIEEVGEGLPAFLETHSSRAEMNFLPDLARLEWSVLTRLYTNRAPAFDPRSLTDVPENAWPRARVELDPTVQLLKTDHAVDRLWKDRMRPANEGKKQGRTKKARWLLLHRDDTWVRVRSMEEREWRVLERFQKGDTLGEMCAALEKDTQGKKAPPVQQWLSEWIQSGIIKKIRFDDVP